MTTQFGKFQLLKKIAAGGMAEIHLAKLRGMEGFEKLVVIKMVLPNLVGNQEFVQMFLDEARLAAKLNHPNIVQIFDMGKAGGTYFIAMEYIQGENLRAIVKTSRKAGRILPVEHAVKIISQSAEGLYYAHAKTDMSGNPLHIVHRDISPQNIMVSFDGVVKVVDFGIAKAATQYQETRAGVLKGKYSYMSPEQCTGQPVDARSDIFALGIVLWELATGMRLFKQSSELMILKEITEGVVPPPRQVNQHVPAELEAIILKALARNREHRFPDALHMHLALEEFLKNQGLTSSTVHLSAFMRDLFPDRLEFLAKLEAAQASGDSLQSFLFDDVSLEEGSGSHAGASTPSQPSRSARVGSQPLYPRPTTGVSRVGPLPLGPAGTPQPGPRPGSGMTPSPAPAPRSSALLFVVLGALLLVMGGLGYLLWERFRDPGPEGPAEDAGVAPAGPRGSILVSSVPEGGEVAIDGNVRCKAPCTVKELEVGRLMTLTVSLPGHQTWTTQFKLEDEKDIRSFNARLETRAGHKATGQARVVTDPPGASLSLDGKPVPGVTPLTLTELEAERDHALVATLQGYSSWRQTFRVKAGGSLTLEGKLPKATAPPPGAKRAVYSLRSSPSGARFFLDGAPVGGSVQLEPGRSYELVARLAGHNDWNEQLEPSSGEKRTVTARLTRREAEVRPPPTDAKARLTIDSEPWAVVFLDGEKIGQTPLSDVVIPAGTHQIRLVNSELSATKTLEIDAKPGQVIRQKVEFGKGSLVVKARPWAHVFIGTRKLGTTPFEPKELFEGTYRVKLENPTIGDSVTKTVTIKAGQQAVLEHDFLAGQE